MKLRHLLFVIVVCAGFINSERNAEARGLMIVNTGLDVTHVSELNDAAKAELVAEAQDMKIGYAYERFGVFWLDIWRWDGQFVFYKGDELFEEEEETIAAAAAGPLSRPISYRLPPGLWVLVGGAIIFGLFTVFGKGKEGEQNDVVVDQNLGGTEGSNEP